MKVVNTKSSWSFLMSRNLNSKLLFFKNRPITKYPKFSAVKPIRNIDNAVSKWLTSGSMTLVTAPEKLCLFKKRKFVQKKVV